MLSRVDRQWGELEPRATETWLEAVEGHLLDLTRWFLGPDLRNALKGVSPGALRCGELASLDVRGGSDNSAGITERWICVNTVKE